ncbi:hypothetical protein POM88_014933 [Heracleum sosnowskyi]|uniref:Uncharacterized protein n=1 Tax=Heracleum sosnowskyi TaxID=360622 RepID=A0AAD8IIB0_9APIA|nr:hypothetical protein POM88_022135 [Heracleum sosnowskyi]KAK1386755.1 hypothetical protein POM88_014933 [Heracleum sosnowskyi]
MNISIESAKKGNGGGSSNSGSCGSGISDDESRDVEKDTAVVETRLVVDTVEPVEPGQVVKLVEPIETLVEVYCSDGKTGNWDVQTAPLVESEKDPWMEDTVEMIESALTEIPDTSYVLELDLLEVGEKKMLTLDKNNTVYPGLVGLGSENKELTTSEKAVVCSDAKDSATEMQEDKLELSCNSFVGNNNNGALPVPDYQNPEYSGNQIPVASTSHAVQKAFVNS